MRAVGFRGNGGIEVREELDLVAYGDLGRHEEWTASVRDVWKGNRAIAGFTIGDLARRARERISESSLKPYGCSRRDGSGPGCRRPCPWPRRRRHTNSWRRAPAEAKSFSSSSDHHRILRSSSQV